MTRNKKGFTIIEVVLVLAIAGLIFLMVFIALPALQRSQRNTRRRQDMARILSAFNDYQSNNNGSMPDGASKLKEFVPRYVDSNCVATGTVTFKNCGDQFKDPDGTDYSMTYHLFSASFGAVTNCRYDGNGCGKGGGAPKEDSITHVIHYWPKGKCSASEGVIDYDGSQNNIAIAYYLEGGAIYCGDNQ